MKKIDPETELSQEPGDRIDKEIRDAELAQEDGSKLIRMHGQFWITDWGGDEPA